MRLSEVRASNDRVWTAAPATDDDARDLSPGSEVLIALDDALIRVTSQSGSALLRPQSQADRAVAEATAAAGRRALIEVLDVGRTVTFRTLEFASATRSISPRHIAVDDDVMAFLPDRWREVSVEATCRRLEDALVVDRARQSIIVTAGREQGPVADSASVRIEGDGLAVDVKAVDGLWRIVRSVTGGQRHIRPRHLVEGEIRFVPATHAARLDEVANAEFELLYRSVAAYFNIWRDYADIELQHAESAAKALGVAGYDHFRPNLDGSFTFYLAAEPGSELLLEKLEDGELDLSASASPDLEDAPRARDAGRLHGIARFTPQYGERAVTIMPLAKPRAELPGTGFVYGSRVGDVIRHDRRLRALEMEEFVPRKAVRQFLEGVAPSTVRLRRPIEPLSDTVIEAFGGRPTDAQLRALDIALNTPDIALIQGPPGTGKTRVIAALQARLAELEATGSAISSRILLTSEQHDAVQNTVAASVDRRLPPIKLGGRVGHADDEHLTEWAFTLRARLSERQAQRPQPRLLAIWFELQDRVTAFEAGADDPADTYRLLRWIREQAGELLESDLRTELDQAIQHSHRLSQLTLPVAQVDTIERHARSLRTEASTFADDGAVTCRAARALLATTDTLRPTDLRLLEKLADMDVPAPAQLRLLRAVKERLLDLCVSSRRAAWTASSHAAIGQLIFRARTDATRAIERRVDPIDLAVARFARRLTDEPVSVKQSVLRHTSSLAATCQQTLGRDVEAVQLSEAPFATVIIDEAARANPLDLLIPMSLGQRRVIFVGDHRQLPQMLEPAVRRAMTTKLPDDALSDVLEQSFFERLFTSLSERASDVPRTVTLDQQFRMNPLLGTFISEHFYRPHGEQVLNGFGTEKRTLEGLPFSSPAVWIDVPRGAGLEFRGAGRHGPSWRRQPEAEVAVTLLCDLVDRDDARTIGVITFYTGQELAIWEELDRRGLAIREDGGYRLSPTWGRAHSEAMLPRIRIGTVDSFQGREFDVAILSLVRCNDPGARLTTQRRFGFLTHTNRLCVAMSRQRDALIVIGDHHLFGTDTAKTAVPALHAFTELAEVRDG
jgi:hypothetical protein